MYTRSTLNRTKTLLMLTLIKNIVWDLHDVCIDVDIDVDVVVNVVVVKNYISQQILSCENKIDYMYLWLLMLIEEKEEEKKFLRERQTNLYVEWVTVNFQIYITNKNDIISNIINNIISNIINFITTFT